MLATVAHSRQSMARMTSREQTQMTGRQLLLQHLHQLPLLLLLLLLLPELS